MVLGTKGEQEGWALHRFPLEKLSCSPWLSPAFAKDGCSLGRSSGLSPWASSPGSWCRFFSSSIGLSFQAQRFPAPTVLALGASPGAFQLLQFLVFYQGFLILHSYGHCHGIQVFCWFLTSLDRSLTLFYTRLCTSMINNSCEFLCPALNLFSWKL